MDERNIHNKEIKRGDIIAFESTIYQKLIAVDV